jgi:hypothetical protein
MSPLLVRSCNGTTAGLGYLELIWIVLEKVLPEQLTCVRTIMLQNTGSLYDKSA